MTSSLRLRQVFAYAVLCLFLLGFFYGPVALWTGPILGVWFVGTQRLRRGFLWMLGFTLLFSLPHLWRHPGWTMVAAVLSVLPFTLHRLTSPRLPGILSTLPFPIYGAALAAAGAAWLPAGAVESHQFAMVFMVDWFAALVICVWNREFRAAAYILGEYSPETLAILRSPATGAPLLLDGKSLASTAGERFPIRAGIADLRRPEDLTGSNEKYNHLYESIGGFYDDSQRVVCALSGFDRATYVMSYLGRIEVKPGDSVLETSVGTGLNFQYLPRGVRLAGLDLSPEMLINCQNNLRRWRLNADLFLGNAESLPFADESFDVVFHVGGINFFNDRAKAIREMIRVARPGSPILIADETEEHVKAAFERAPITGSYFKGRKEAVTAPVDLVPPEMEEVHLEILNVIGKNRFYALTFRKPDQLPAGGLEERSRTTVSPACTSTVSPA